MDDNVKNNASYQLDQEILDARGIKMTVEEVAGLSTCKYSERVQSLKLSDEDLGFLKGLRRRIKNRLASQNSRRRSVEHLRRLTRELRAVRACRRDAINDRRTLITRRDSVRDKCCRLRSFIVEILKQRQDTTQVPSIEINLSSQTNQIKNVTASQTKSEEYYKEELLLEEEVEEEEFYENEKNHLKNDIFECKLSKLVQQSVNHIYKDEKKRVFAKTVFISNDEVLNLSVKEGRRRSHGRKQLAPRRITHVNNFDDGVLDLKVKKET